MKINYFIKYLKYFIKKKNRVERGQNYKTLWFCNTLTSCKNNLKFGIEETFVHWKVHWTMDANKNALYICIYMHYY